MTNINYENKRLLDVVDENDLPIDLKPRNVVHNLGLRHRDIHVWFFDKNHNIFFQKRGIHRPSAGLLDASVGGHVNKGEKYLEAAIRESKEETGISIKKSQLVLLKKVKGTDKRAKNNFIENVNNFFRSIYIYKLPIESEKLKKEEGIPGGGFEKLSFDLLKNSSKKYQKMFLPFVYKEELPLVLEYLKKKK